MGIEPAMSDDKGINERKGWRWADGEMHDSPPPSSQDFPPVEAIMAAAPVTDAALTTAPTKRPEVASNFLGKSPRVLLRITAMDFALRAAQVAKGSTTGEELISAAEEIERWMAQVDGK